MQGEGGGGRGRGRGRRRHGKGGALLADALKRRREAAGALIRKNQLTFALNGALASQRGPVLSLKALPPHLGPPFHLVVQPRPGPRPRRVERRSEAAVTRGLPRGAAEQDVLRLNRLVNDQVVLVLVALVGAEGALQPAAEEGEGLPEWGGVWEGKRVRGRNR